MKSDLIGLYFTVDDFLLTFTVMAAIMLILFILLIVNIAKTGRLRKKYEAFMMGKNAESLEDTLVKRIQQVDELLVSESENRENIENYREIYLKVSHDTLYRRDQKKLYSTKAKNVVGVDLPWDEPGHSSIVIQNDGQESPEEIVDRLMNFFGLE